MAGFVKNTSDWRGGPTVPAPAAKVPDESPRRVREPLLPGDLGVSNLEDETDSIPVDERAGGWLTGYE